MGVGGQQHNRPQFLAWHRELLRQFEIDLRTIGEKPNVSIPYWDWTEDFPINKAVCCDNGFMGGTSGAGNPLMLGPFRQGQWTPLKTPTNSLCDTTSGGALIRDNASAVATISRTDLRDLLRAPFYDAAPWDGTGDSANGLRRKLEILHDRAHVWVGGLSPIRGHMACPKTANDDPVFWLHHCFVDCMWAAWQDLHPTTPHYEPEAGDATATGFQSDEDNLEMFPWGTSTTPKSVLNFRALGYTYEQNDSHVIPTVSEWAVVVMVLVLLVAGTIVFAGVRKGRSAAA